MTTPVSGPQRIQLPELQLGRAKSSLSEIPANADAAALKGLIDSNLETIKRGKPAQIAKSEASWLQSVANHPNADNSVLAHMHGAIKDIKLADAAKNAGFGRFMAAIGTASTGVASVNVGPGNTNPTVTGTAGSSTNAATGNSGATGVVGTLGGQNVPQTTGPDPKRMLDGPHEVPAAWAIPAEVKAHFGTPEEKLNLDVLKSTVNAQTPFFQTQSDAFRSVLMLNSAKMLEQAGAPLPTLLQHLTENLAVPTSNVMVKQADGTEGIRASVYSDNWSELIDIVKSDPTSLFMKIMQHRNDGHKVGGPETVSGGDAFVFGATHQGWFDVVQDENGEDKLLRGDYPTDYGAPPSGTREYTFRMSAVNAGKMEFEQPVSKEKLLEAANFSRTLAVLGMAKVPFSSNDTQSWDQSYFINDLGLDRGSKVQPFVDQLSANMNDTAVNAQGEPILDANGDTMTVEDWLRNESKYCAEGAHDRPAHLLHARPTEGLKEMKKVFDAAVSEDQTARGAEHPDNRVGWKALEDAGFIHNYDGLIETDAAYMAFHVPGDDYKPLIEYGPKDAIKTDGPGNGLMSQPLTIGGLAEAAIGTLFPRDRMAETIGGGLIKAFTEAQDPADKMKILGEAKVFVQGAVQKAQAAAGAAGAQFAPMPPLGNIHEVASAFGLTLASGVQSGMINSDELGGKIKEQARYEYMDQASQAKFDAIFTKLAGVVANPTMGGKKLQAFLEGQRKDIREDMTFTFEFPGQAPTTEELIEYLPPHHFNTALRGWAQANGQEYVGDFFPSGFAK